MSDFHLIKFQGNPDQAPLARGMKINVDGRLLEGVKGFQIQGKAGGLITAKVEVDAELLELVADGRLEGDAELARAALLKLAGPPSARELADLIGRATGEYPEWDLGQQGVIEAALLKRLAEGPDPDILPVEGTEVVRP